jgi:hypothetical protein
MRQSEYVRDVLSLKEPVVSNEEALQTFKVIAESV